MKLFTWWNKLKADINSNKIKKSFYSWSFSCLIIIATHSAPAQAVGTLLYQYSCSLPTSPTSPTSPSSPVTIPSSWQAKFPFDLIYPIPTAGYTAPTCPVIDLWGTPREVCSVGMLTGVAKNVFLLKVVISSLLSL